MRNKIHLTINKFTAKFVWKSIDPCTNLLIDIATSKHKFWGFIIKKSLLFLSSRKGASVSEFVGLTVSLSVCQLKYTAVLACKFIRKKSFIKDISH